MLAACSTKIPPSVCAQCQGETQEGGPEFWRHDYSVLPES